MQGIMDSKLQLVLLDTMIVAGLFALSKKGIHVKQQRAMWVGAVFSILPRECAYLVPTSVCYELMSWNKEWHAFILGMSDTVVFKAVNDDIPANILHLAASYSAENEIVYFDDKKYKVKSLDPITAAYAMVNRCFILTENEKDFPESYFSVRSSQLILLPQKQGVKRRIIYLLEPKKNV